MPLIDDRKDSKRKWDHRVFVADSLVAHQRACFIANLDKRNREALQSLGDFWLSKSEHYGKNHDFLSYTSAYNSLIS